MAAGSASFYDYASAMKRLARGQTVMVHKPYPSGGNPLPSLRSTPVCRPINFVRFVMFSPAFYKSDIDR